MTTSRLQGSVVTGSFHPGFTERVPARVSGDEHGEVTEEEEEEEQEGSSVAEEEQEQQEEEQEQQEEEDDEDLEATVLAVNQRSAVTHTPAAAAAAAAARRTSTRAGVRPPPPEAVDDYLRNFLLKTGMTRTLDCFQTEWSEMQRRGLLDPALVGAAVADVYAQNHRLDGELTSARRARDELRAVASAAADALAGLRRARDFHRAQHQRVLQEKSRLAEDVRRLRAQCGRYEPAVRQISERYRSVFRQKALVSLERDRALAQVQRLQATLHNTTEPPGGGGGGGGGGGRRQSPNQGAVRQQASCKTKPAAKKAAEPPGAAKQRGGVAGDSRFPGGRRRGNNWPLSAEAPGPVRSDAPSDKAKAEGFQLRSTIKAHSRPISCLARHPSECTVASCGDDDRLWKLWGLPGGAPGASGGQGHDTDGLSGISFHPDGTKLGTTGGDASVRIWDLRGPAAGGGRLVLSLRGHSGATRRCSFHSGGDFVASCSLDASIKVWDLRSERCRSTLLGHRGSVSSVEFLGASGLLSSCADKTLRLWDARTGQCCQTIRGHSSPLNAATAAPSSCSSCSPCSFSFSSSSPPCSFSFSSSSPCSPSSSSSSSPSPCSSSSSSHSPRSSSSPSPRSSSSSSPSVVIASCDSSGVVMVWDARNLAAPSVVVETGPRPSNQVAFDPRGKALAVAGADGAARVIDPSTGRVAGVLRHGDAVQSVTFDATGEYLLAGAADGQVYVWS